MFDVISNCATSDRPVNGTEFISSSTARVQPSGSGVDVFFIALLTNVSIFKYFSEIYSLNLKTQDVHFIFIIKLRRMTL